MILLRQYKLWKLNIPVDSKFIEIFEFVNSTISNLQTFEMSEYADWLFFMNSENLNILQFETKKRILYVRYSNFWEVLETKYNLEYSDIQPFIQSLVEEAYKIKVETTAWVTLTALTVVEEAYKIKVETTISFSKYCTQGGGRGLQNKG